MSGTSRHRLALSVTLVSHMWMCILVGLNIITIVCGYSDGIVPEACESMSPKHQLDGGHYCPPKTTESPFMVDYVPVSDPKDPVTVILKTKEGYAQTFMGFMLEARRTSMGDSGHPVGKFILLEPDKSQLLTCNGVEGLVVSQKNNQMKSLIRVNWTAPEEEKFPTDIIFRATFVQTYDAFWERVNITLSLPTTTTKRSMTKSTTNPNATTTTRKVTLVALVMLVITGIELLLLALPLGPSHELKEIRDVTFRVCTTIQVILTTAITFVGVMDRDNCGATWEDSWLKKVMIAFSVWMFLFVIWIFVHSTILARRKIGSSQKKEQKCKKKKNNRAADGIAVAFAIIFICGTTSFVVVIITGLVICQKI